MTSTDDNQQEPVTVTSSSRPSASSVGRWWVNLEQTGRLPDRQLREPEAEAQPWFNLNANIHMLTRLTCGWLAENVCYGHRHGGVWERTDTPMCQHQFVPVTVVASRWAATLIDRLLDSVEQRNRVGNPGDPVIDDRIDQNLKGLKKWLERLEDWGRIELVRTYTYYTCIVGEAALPETWEKLQDDLGEILPVNDWSPTILRR